MAKRTISRKGGAYLTGTARHEVAVALRDIAQAEAPTTIRHLFYRACTLFPDRIPKPDAGARKVGEIVNRMRWDGEIAWEWIRDTSRHPVYAGGYYDAADFLARHAATYRVNAWEHVPDSVTVWCESESAMGMIDQMCAAKGVHLYPCRGHPSNDFIWRAIRTMSESTDVFGTAHLLYVGDWDKEGREIPFVLERKLRDDFRQFVDFDFEFARLAVNEAQIEEYGLPLETRQARRPDVRAGGHARADVARDRRCGDRPAHARRHAGAAGDGRSRGTRGVGEPRGGASPAARPGRRQGRRDGFGH